MPRRPYNISGSWGVYDPETSKPRAFAAAVKVAQRTGWATVTQGFSSVVTDRWYFGPEGQMTEAEYLELPERLREAWCEPCQVSYPYEHQHDSA
jgi:hypothetical protein